MWLDGPGLSPDEYLGGPRRGCWSFHSPPAKLPVERLWGVGKQGSKVFQRLGQAGLVRLNERGEACFRYSCLYDRVPPIDDCYALNVCSAEEVWVYYP